MLFFLSLLGIASIQFVCALLAIRFRTDKLTDISYGGTFLVVVWGLYLWGSSQHLIHFFLVVLISLWAVRLALYLFLRVLALGKDKRFDGIREQKHAFMKFRLLQGVGVFLLLVPVIQAMSVAEPLVTWYTLLGIVVTSIGIILESIADRQKFRFKQQYPTRRCAVGIWSKLQYPNYLGEILVWVGIYLVCLSSLSGGQVMLGLISPFTILWLLLFVTGIPPLEREHQRKWGDEKEWRNYVSTTPKLLPGIW